MLVKIDTKGNFTVFELLPTEIHANMAEDLREIFSENQMDAAAIVDWKKVARADQTVAEVFMEIQSRYREKDKSFVMTGLNPSVLIAMKALPGYADLNIAPTFPEAVDLVMMEKLERELLNPDE